MWTSGAIGTCLLLETITIKNRDSTAVVCTDTGQTEENTAVNLVRSEATARSTVVYLSRARRLVDLLVTPMAPDRKVGKTLL